MTLVNALLVMKKETGKEKVRRANGKEEVARAMPEEVRKDTGELEGKAVVTSEHI